MSGEDNPTKNGDELPGFRQTLLRACELAGLNPKGAWLIHHYANVVYLLPLENAVARLQQGSHLHRRAAMSLNIARWLVADHGFPATTPLAGTEAIAVDETTTATFWTYYPQRDDSLKPTSAHLGKLR